MRSAILGFVGGVTLLQGSAALPDRGSMIAGCAIAALLLLLRRRTATVLAGALLGAVWAALLAHAALAPRLAAADEGRDITLVGVVDSLPYRFDGGVRFTFTVEQAGNVHVPPRVSLAWYSGLRGQVVEVGDVRPGERWRLTVRLQRPHGNANPYVSVSWTKLP
ncbi:DUF4131 domain-containing protein [Duganella sp. FT3S]|uniref:DUF4131 domain-containing protein n=1 Tax=Rugamonas fusca TaxID=2758568 RepID=A0A7W2EDX3_9BURK|nr:ComEC/Rec2 family competence protein [Rugamonas fusca]MBA5603865.1 DUF4131 domain-containing protein [Rugamonas fusca]